ncbi:MAG TPA: MG2 domain-containing protein, partial [Longimicrobiaceae bacterium]
MPLRSRTGRVLRALTLLLPALAVAAHAPAQQRPRTVSVPPVQPRHVPSPEPQPGPADTTGLRFRLSEGRAGSGSGAQRPRATAGTPLSAEETARLLSRLPALRADSSAADSFVFPPQSAPPPRTGALVRASFPAPDSAARPAAPAAGALEVVRRGPEGAVDTGAGVTVVFSQPMVPLSSVSEVAARDVPVTLTPQPRGRWRWLDVRTLVFEPEGRMPAATRYTVEVAPRARSTLGAVLSAPVRWSFATPAPRATGGYPQGEPATRDPLVLLTWDQAVDPAAVLPHVRVRAGGTEHRLRLATPAEVAADERAAALLRGHEPGRWTAFRLVAPLPGDAQVRVSVEPGAPSAEGPLRTETVQEWSFRTYGPLRVTGQACGYRDECRPGWPWRVELSNPLDTQAWHDSLVRVEPALPGLHVQVWGNVVMVSGRARPMTTYRVTLHPSVRDRFGQILGRAEPRVFRVGAPVGRLWSVGEAFLVLDPAGPRRVSVFSNDLERLRVRVLRVRPEDYPAFAAAVGRGRGRGPGGAPALPGQVVVSRVVTPGTEPGVAAEIGVDLSPALVGGLGHVVVAVEPEAPRDEEERGQAVYLWVQSTRIGLTALADDRSLVTWATSLVDGAPLPGTVLTLNGAERATTRADGLGTLPLPGSTPSEGGVLVARLGSDVALLPERAGRGGWGGWQRQTVRDGAAWYVATDRNLYRPGEQLRFKGWVRRLVRGDDGGPALLRGADSLRYTVRDGEGNEIGAGAVRLTPLGGFDGTFTLPPGTRLGSASIHLKGPAVEGVGDVEHQAQFEVQEFRRP